MLEDYFTYSDEPIDDYIEIFFDHPNLQDAFLSGKIMPYGHPSADYLVSVEHDHVPCAINNLLRYTDSSYDFLLKDETITSDESPRH